MSPEMIHAVIVATWETLFMVFVSGFFATIVGIPLGIYIFISRSNSIWPQPRTNRLLELFVNALRSIPFIILLVAIIPLTRFIAGTSIGTVAAVVPLAIAAIPFVGRLTDTALQEISPGLIECGEAMGATPAKMVWHIFLPEALPSLIHAITLTLVTLVGYSAMAGTVGGGGLGDLAIQYGYQRFDVTIMLVTVVILIIMVQCFQWIGDKLAKLYSH